MTLRLHSCNVLTARHAVSAHSDAEIDKVGAKVEQGGDGADEHEDEKNVLGADPDGVEAGVEFREGKHVCWRV